MVSVAFYLENRSLISVDFCNVTLGNPGVGGSEYMTVLVAQLLSSRNNGITVTLYVQKEGLFDSSINTKVVDGLHECIIDCNQNDIDYLFFKHDMTFVDNRTLCDSSKTALVPWCHNFAPYKALNYYAKNKNIARILCVGHEQQDLYRDLMAFRKSDYIFNCISEEIILKRHAERYPYKERKNIVTYIGAIGPQKGFHWLAEAWPIILQQVPDAELYVIGSGALYGRDVKLGKFGIAEREYEEQFMPYLTKDGEILSCVHFMGIMGEEKNDILLRTKVGVPNPSGFSETFGISAVEMQAMGCKVATICCAGYLDTVKNGILYHRKTELADAVIKLLRDESDGYDSTIQFILDNFSQAAVVKEWERFILYALPNNKTLHALENRNMDFEYKKLKEMVRPIKPFLPFLPSVEFCSRLFEKVLCIKQSHPHRNISR